MRVVVVGGGKVGSHLARELKRNGDTVVVVERDPDRADRVAEDTGVLVLRGDGSDPIILQQAEIHRVDWLLAVTGRDEDNFVACQIAGVLGARHTLARLNDPRNAATFRALGIPAVEVTEIIADVISREVTVVEQVVPTLLARGHIAIIEGDIAPDRPDRRLEDLDLPRPGLVIAIVRGDDVIVPTPDTLVRAGDRVVAVTTLGNEAGMRAGLGVAGG